MSSAGEDLAILIRSCLQPISDDLPAGTDPATDPRHMAVRIEARKLGSATAGRVDWDLMLESGSALLRSTSKDLVAGVVVALSLHVLKGEEGLVAGLDLVSGLMKSFWPAIFPQRAAQRISYIGWLIDRTAKHLSLTQGVDPTCHAHLEAAATRFGQVVGERLERGAPSLRPLVEQIERLRPAVVEVAPVALAPPVAHGSDEPVPVLDGAPVRRDGARSGAEVEALQEAAPKEAPQTMDAVLLTREVGASLVRAAHVLRRSNLGNGMAYRLLRVGRWLHLARAPSPESDGRTRVAALSEENRSSLHALAERQAWASLVEQSETLLEGHSFCLDLHRFSAVGLQQLGATHADARSAVVLELASLLRRMPTLMELCDSSGRPLADDETKDWIRAEVMRDVTSPSGAETSALGLALPSKDVLPREDSELVGLVVGRSTGEAIALLQQRCASAESGRIRFRARLELARVAVEGGRPELAVAIHEALDKECVTRGLEDWDPALASEALRGHISCLKALDGGGKDATIANARASLLRRLSGFDPLAAFELGR